MDETSKTLKPWLTFAGCVLVVVVLYWAQAVFVPIALAILLTPILKVSAPGRLVGRRSEPSLKVSTRLLKDRSQLRSYRTRRICR